MAKKKSDAISNLFKTDVYRFCDTLRKLVKAGTSIDAATAFGDQYNGYTPLLFAVENQYESAVCLCLYLGANTRATTPAGLTAAQLAKKHENKVILGLIEIFEQQKAADFTSEPVRLAVHKLIEFAHHEKLYDMPSKLKKMGVPLNVRDNEGRTPLHEAASRGWDEIVKSLAEAGVNLDERVGEKKRSKDWKPSHLDILWGKPETALMLAARLPHLSTMELLLKCGADPNVRLEDGTTAVTEALINGRREYPIDLVVNLLMKAGATVDGTTAKICPYTPSTLIREIVPKNTPFWLAANNKVAKLAAELKKGLSVNAKTPNGMTLLHWACAGDAPECVQLLLDAGADLCAVADGSEIIKVSLEQESDVEAMLPLDYANCNCRRAVKLILRKNDPRWAAMPVVYLGALTKSAVVKAMQAYEARERSSPSFRSEITQSVNTRATKTRTAKGQPAVEPSSPSFASDDSATCRLLPPERKPGQTYEQADEAFDRWYDNIANMGWEDMNDW